MKRIYLVALAIAMVCAFGGATASPSLAVEKQCLKVVEPGTGNWKDPICTESTTSGEYIKVNEPGQSLSPGIMCAEVVEEKTGTYSNAQCTGTAGKEGKYIKVYERLHWWTNGNQLKQGKMQVKIISVQTETELKGKVVSMNAWISCKTALTQNAYIEGYGINQGQGSASNITFENCTTHEPKKCVVNEPIKTSQLKSHLVLYTNKAGQVKMGELFEPSQGEKYVEISFKNGAEACPLGAEKFPVKGGVVGNIFPEGQEGQVGHLTFPVEPITTITHEGQTRKVGLFLGTVEATFSGIFEAQLSPPGKWGVFGGS